MVWLFMTSECCNLGLISIAYHNRSPHSLIHHIYEKFDIFAVSVVMEGLEGAARIKLKSVSVMHYAFLVHINFQFNFLEMHCVSYILYGITK